MSVQNLNKASVRWKSKAEQFYQTKTTDTKAGPPSRCFRKIHAFFKYIIKKWFIDLAFGFFKYKKKRSIDLKYERTFKKFTEENFI